MIKKHLFPLVSIYLCLAILVGCEATDTSIRDDSPKLYSENNWKKPAFVNTNNPYDYLGAIHNEGLEYINNRMGMNIYIDTLYPNSDTLAIHFVDSVLGYSLHPDTLAKHLKLCRFAVTRRDSILNNAPFSSLAQSYMDQMAVILGATTPGSLLSLEDQISGLIALEDSVVANLSGPEEQVLLIGAAIGRYSVAYWRSDDSLTWPAFEYHQRAIVYSPMTKLNSSRPQYVNPWSTYMFFKKNRWAQQDAFGALGGGVAGSIGGPWGAILGGLGGAIMMSGGAL